MKNLIPIIVLTLLQTACAAPQAAPGTRASLLDFDVIGAEITVGYEDLSSQNDASQTVAMHTDL